MLLFMGSQNIKLTKCGDGFYRTWWNDDKGKRHTRSFGKVKKSAENRFSRFYANWRSASATRNPDEHVDLTLSEAYTKFAAHAKAYYVRGDGTATGEHRNFDDAMRQALALFGNMPARDFDVSSLRTVREAMVDEGSMAVSTINYRVRKLRQIWRWFASEKIVSASAWAEMASLAPLAPGRAVMVQGKPVTPRATTAVQAVPDSYVWDVTEAAPPTIAAMIKLQYYTGMRPGEVCAMRPCDIDTTGKIWTYKPAQHKTLHHQKTRTIIIGPRGQSVLRPFLKLDRPVDRPVFRPVDAWTERHAMRVRDYTPGGGKGDYRKWAGYQAKQAERKPRGGDAWTVKAYAKAIRRICEDLEIDGWSPNQLRHNTATRLRKVFNLDTVQAVLGHSKADVTEIYAELDQTKAIAAMEAAG